MSAEDLGQPDGPLTLARGAATGNLAEIVKGTASILGLESNNSRMQRLVAIDYERWLADTLFQLLGASQTNGETSSRNTSRLDDYGQRLHRLNWLIEEFERRLADTDARVADLAALFGAGYDVWQRNAEPKKRELLARLLSRAFDPQVFLDGRIGEFVELLSQLRVRQVNSLIRLAKTEKDSLGFFPISLGYLDGVRLSQLGLAHQDQRRFQITELGREFVELLA